MVATIGAGIVMEPGRCRVAGVPRGRFSEVLEGSGRVFGVRFRPAGLRPYLGRPVSSITDRFLGPKWVIRRYRLHEAAARAVDGVDLDLVRLAADLGYSDQAHLTRDFASTIGLPPARYARAQ